MELKFDDDNFKSLLNSFLILFISLLFIVNDLIKFFCILSSTNLIWDWCSCLSHSSPAPSTSIETVSSSSSSSFISSSFIIIWLFKSKFLFNPSFNCLFKLKSVELINVVEFEVDWIKLLRNVFKLVKLFKQSKLFDDLSRANWKLDCELFK